MTHEDKCPPKDLYLNGQCSFTYNNRKLTGNQMSGELIKIMEYPFSGILLSNKKEWIPGTSNKMDIFFFQKLILIEISQKQDTYYMIPFIWTFRKSKIIVISRSGVRNWGRGVDCKEEHGNFGGLTETFIMILVLVTWWYVFVKTHQIVLNSGKFYHVKFFISVN